MPNPDQLGCASLLKKFYYYFFLLCLKKTFLEESQDDTLLGLDELKCRLVLFFLERNTNHL